MRMKSYNKHATFLSTLNLALANYVLVSKDGRYKKPTRLYFTTITHRIEG